MKRYSIILLFVTTAICTAMGQAGTGVFQFLDLPISSRLAALGGTNVSIKDNDLNFAFQNPSLLTSDTHNMISLNYSLYMADIMFGSAMYSHNYKKNYFAAGIHYIDYGTFTGMDEVGNPTSNFTAKDFAINLIYAQPLNEMFTIGATLKPIYSVYERYSSFAIAADIGAHFQSKSKLFSMGLVFRNMGLQLKGYYDHIDGKQHREPLPFDIQLGLSGKFQHAPIRLSMTLHNLQRWDLSYQLTNQPSDNEFGTDEAPKKGVEFIDMAFRHAIFAIDITPTKNMYLTVSYDHRRRMEMAIDNFKSLSGFAFGAGVKIYKFHVGFGMTQFQLGHYAYQFSLATALSDFGL